jgi:hypothetical protein
MNCPHCGHPISPTDRFCSNCGVDLGVEETMISQALPPTFPPPSPMYNGETLISQAPPPPLSAYEPSPEGETNGRKVVLIVAVALILLCCCCLIAVLAAYMLLGEGILDEILREISLAPLLV